MSTPINISHTFSLTDSYTREEAIHDGVLKDLTPISQAIGFHFPIAITFHAWDCITQAQKAFSPTRILDNALILEILCQLHQYIRKHKPTGSFFSFHLWAAHHQHAPMPLKVHFGPDETKHSVLTIMMPEEV